MINPADWSRLEEYRDEVLAAVCERYGVEPMNVCNWRSNLDHRRIHARSFKTAPVCHARYDLICILRTTVFQCRRTSRPDIREMQIERDGKEWIGKAGSRIWDRLSLPNIGRLVGCDHVTAMNALKRRVRDHGDWRLTLVDYLA